MKTLTVTALIAALAMVPTSSVAQGYDPYAGLEPVITQPSYAGCADPMYNFFEEGPCEGLVSSPVSGTAFIWVVFTRVGGLPNGIGGIQFGIDYGPGLDLTDWHLCTGGNQIPEDDWPDPGTGNAMTWAGGCYEPPGTNARIGFFTVSDGSVNDFFATLPDPRIDEAVYADCWAAGYEICAWNLNCVLLADGGEPHCYWTDCGGYPPNCEPSTPTEKTSWGVVKALYR